MMVRAALFAASGARQRSVSRRGLRALASWGGSRVSCRAARWQRLDITSQVTTMSV